MYLNGIDISHHQGNMNLSVVPCDFVIMKATEGTSFKDNMMNNFYSQAVANNKIVGLYHFANGKSTGVEEAQFFLSVIGDKYNDSLLVLDWEADALKKGVAYAKAFLDYVKEKTGKIPYIYMSASVTRQYDWSSVANTYPLWVAQYASYNTTGYQVNPWKDNKGLGAWKYESIRQYSSNGRLSGYNGNLDLDIMYEIPSTIPTSKSSGNKPVSEIAQEVVNGKWGNGEDRRIKLAAAGYDYNEVQKAVNALLNSANLQKTINNIANKYVVGHVYHTVVEKLHVRDSVNGAILIRSQLTTNARINSDEKGRLNKGVAITCKAIKISGGSIWMKIPSGWVCAYKDGEYYIK